MAGVHLLNDFLLHLLDLILLFFAWYTYRFEYGAFGFLERFTFKLQLIPFISKIFIISIPPERLNPFSRAGICQIHYIFCWHFVVYSSIALLSFFCFNSFALRGLMTLFPNFSCTIISYNWLNPSFVSFRFKSLQYLRGLLLSVKVSIMSITEKNHFPYSLSQWTLIFFDSNNLSNW